MQNFKKTLTKLIGLTLLLSAVAISAAAQTNSPMPTPTPSVNSDATRSAALPDGIDPLVYIQLLQAKVSSLTTELAVEKSAHEETKGNRDEWKANTKEARQLLAERTEESRKFQTSAIENQKVVEYLQKDNTELRKDKAEDRREISKLRNQKWRNLFIGGAVGFGVCTYANRGAIFGNN